MKRFALLWMVLGLLAASVQAAPVVGEMAPGLSLTDQYGKLRNMNEFRGKWLVLYFYPKADTPGCTTEACGFRDDIVVLRALGAEVVGVSTDDVKDIRAFGDKYQLPLTLLADADGKVSERYGVLMGVGPIRFAKRHTFLIDPDGKLVKHYSEVDTKQHAKSIIDDLRKLINKPAS